MLPIPEDIALSDAFEGVIRVRMATGYSLLGPKMEFQRLMAALERERLLSRGDWSKIRERHVTEGVKDFTWPANSGG